MWARRDDERILRAREQLRFRVYAAVRNVALRTELFRSNFQLHEPEISVSVYSRYVDVNASLSEAQLRLVPVAGRAQALGRFAEELRTGIEKVAPTLQLEFSVDPASFGGSEPVMAGEAPVGLRAVLLRSDPD